MKITSLGRWALAEKRRLDPEQRAFNWWRRTAISQQIVSLRARREGLVNLITAQRTLAGKHGLEIGGPSFAFQQEGILPLYRVVAAVDGRKANELSGIAEASYDFVLSSHGLHHVNDPCNALVEYRRVLRPGGYLLLVVPLALVSDGCCPLASFDSLTAQWKAEEPSISQRPHHRFSPLLIRQCMEWAGFQMEFIEVSRDFQIAVFGRRD